MLCFVKVFEKTNKSIDRIGWSIFLSGQRLLHKEREMPLFKYSRKKNEGFSVFIWQSRLGYSGIGLSKTMSAPLIFVVLESKLC